MTLSEYTQTPEYLAAAGWSQKAAQAMENGGSLAMESGQPIAADTLTWFAADSYARLEPWEGASRGQHR